MKQDREAWTRIEGILIRIGTNEKCIDEIKKNIQDNYVTKDQYFPIKSIVYGLVGLILMAVLTALLGKVML